jgi:Protein of unknown function (DUF2752)
MWQDIVAFFETHMFSCPSKKYLGMECMGCGLQRSFVLLLKGELGASIALYPALLPMLLMFVFLAVHVKKNFKNGAYILLTLFIINIVIILIHYFIKLFYHTS